MSGVTTATVVAGAAVAASAAATASTYMGQSNAAAGTNAMQARASEQAQIDAAYKAKTNHDQGVYNRAIAEYNAVATENEAIIQRRNAQQARDDAAAAEDAANAEATDVRRAGGRVQSSVRAAAGAGGVLTDSGSPYEVLMENAGEIELSAQRRLFAGKGESRRDLSSADRYDSDAARLDSQAGFIRAGGDMELYKGDLPVGPQNTASLPPPNPSYLQLGAGLLEGGVKAYSILSSGSNYTRPPSSSDTTDRGAWS